MISGARLAKDVLAELPDQFIDHAYEETRYKTGTRAIKGNALELCRTAKIIFAGEMVAKINICDTSVLIKEVVMAAACM